MVHFLYYPLRKPQEWGKRSKKGLKSILAAIARMEKKIARIFLWLSYRKAPFLRKPQECRKGLFKPFLPFLRFCTWGVEKSINHRKQRYINRNRNEIITDDLLGMGLSNQEQHFISWNQYRHLNVWSPMHPYIITGRGSERKVKCPIRKDTVLLGIQMNSTETGYTEYRRRKNGDLEIIQRSEIHDEERLHPEKYDPEMTAEEAEHWRHDDLYLTVSVVKKGYWNPDMHLTMREAVKAKMEQIGYPDTGLEEYVLLPAVLKQLYLIDGFIEEDIEQYLRNGIRYDIRSGYYSKGETAHGR